MDVCVQRLFFRVKHLRYGLCQGLDCWWQMCTGCATDEPTAAKTSNINVTAGDCLSTWQAEKNCLCVLGSHWRRQMLTEVQTVRTTHLFYLRFLCFFHSSEVDWYFVSHWDFFLLTTEGPQQDLRPLTSVAQTSGLFLDTLRDAWED